jgi:hypothetical protein
MFDKIFKKIKNCPIKKENNCMFGGQNANFIESRITTPVISGVIPVISGVIPFNSLTFHLKIW